MDPVARLGEVKKMVMDRIKEEPAAAGKMLAAWMQKPSPEVRR